MMNKDQNRLNCKKNLLKTSLLSRRAMSCPGPRYPSFLHNRSSFQGVSFEFDDYNLPLVCTCFTTER